MISGFSSLMRAWVVCTLCSCLGVLASSSPPQPVRPNKKVLSPCIFSLFKPTVYFFQRSLQRDVTAPALQHHHICEFNIALGWNAAVSFALIMVLADGFNSNAGVEGWRAPSSIADPLS